jgi:hypothetical protein
LEPNIGCDDTTNYRCVNMNRNNNFFQEEEV